MKSKTGVAYGDPIDPATWDTKVHLTAAGKANIIIWPDIDAGNIGVKLLQQFAHADAYGPFLQGFKKIIAARCDFYRNELSCKPASPECCPPAQQPPIPVPNRS